MKTPEQITVSLTTADLDKLVRNLLLCVREDTPNTGTKETPRQIIKAWKKHRSDYLTQPDAKDSPEQLLIDRNANDADVALAEKLLAQLPGKAEGWKEIPVSLTDEQHRVFCALADQIEAKVTPGEVIAGLAIKCLEMGSMSQDASEAHLELSYLVLRARAGVMELDGTWPTGAKAEGAA